MTWELGNKINFFMLGPHVRDFVLSADADNAIKINKRMLIMRLIY
jgi:hypothetical protein